MGAEELALRDPTIDRRERQIEAVAVVFGDRPDQLVLHLKVDDVADVDDHVAALASYGEAVEELLGRRRRLRPRAFDGGLQSLEADRLEQVVQDLGFEGAQRAVVVRTHHDHQELGVSRAKRLGEGDPIGPGHAQVEEDDLRLRLLDDREGRLGVARHAHDLDAELAQHEAQLVPGEGLVVDQHGLQPTHAASRSLGSRSGPWGSPCDGSPSTSSDQGKVTHALIP